MRRAPRSVIRALVAAAAVGAALLVPGAVALQSPAAQPNDISWEAHSFSQTPGDIAWHKTATPPTAAAAPSDIAWHL